MGAHRSQYIIDLEKRIRAAARLFEEEIAGEKKRKKELMTGYEVVLAGLRIRGVHWERDTWALAEKINGPLRRCFVCGRKRLCQHREILVAIAEMGKVALAKTERR